MAARNRTIAFRCHEVDYQEIEAASILRQLPVSEWCRRVLTEAARRELLIASRVDIAKLTAPYFGARAATIGAGPSEDSGRSDASVVDLDLTIGRTDGHTAMNGPSPDNIRSRPSSYKRCRS